MGIAAPDGPRLGAGCDDSGPLSVVSPRGSSCAIQSIGTAALLFAVSAFGGLSLWGLAPELPSAAWTGVREVHAELAAVELRVDEREVL
jgi:hypothetical protein